MRILILFLMLVCAARAQNPIFNALLSHPATSGTGNPPVNGYNFNRLIAVTGTMVSGTNANYTVLVSASDPSLRSVSNGGHVSGTNGADVVFTSNALLTSTMGYEIGHYDPVNGVVQAFVKQPSIQSGSTTTFYMAYGNSSITTAPVSGTTAWDGSSYVGVWHLGTSGTTVNCNDSTVNGNNGTNNGAVPVAGIMGGGAASFASGPYISTPITDLTFGGANAGTIEVWVNPQFGADGNTYELAGQNAGNSNDIFGTYFPYGNGNDYMGWYNGSGERIVVAHTAVQNTWNHIVITWANGSLATLYQNGTLVGTATDNTSASNIGVNFYIGGQNQSGSNGYPWLGYQQEFRMLKIQLSPGQIITDYNNQSNPGNIGSPGFLSFGSEQ